MKELLTYDYSEDPLATLPPFGGAEAESQNSDYSDLAPVDSLYIADVVKSAIGCYPPDAPWHEPMEVWVETLKDRLEPISEANLLVHRYFVETKGADSDIAITTGILTKIGPKLNQIALDQFEQGFQGPKSWGEVSPEASRRLDEIMNVILQDKNNIEFFVQNPSIKKGLDLIQNVLITSSEPDFIYEKHSEYMKACIDANLNGEPILYIPLESDFTSPVKSEDEIAQICEAVIAVVIPMEVKERKGFDNLIETTWDLLKQRNNAHKTNSRLNVIVGTNIMGAGFEVLASTVGESFILKQNGSHEHGFYLAINNLAKKMEYWEASTELMNVRTFGGMEKYYKNLILLYVLHEQGHRLFPVHGIYGEVPADIPAVIYALKMSLDKNQDFEVHEVMKAIVTEYVSEIINDVSEEAWFEGGKANTGNDLFDGYLLSAVVIMNAIADSGLARVNREEMIDVNVNEDNITKLFKDLETVDHEFHKKDEKTLDKIKMAVANPEAEKIIALYRDKIKAYQLAKDARLFQEIDSKADTYVNIHTS